MARDNIMKKKRIIGIFIIVVIITVFVFCCWNSLGKQSTNDISEIRVGISASVFEEVEYVYPGAMDQIIEETGVRLDCEVEYSIYDDEEKLLYDLNEGLLDSILTEKMVEGLDDYFVVQKNIDYGFYSMDYDTVKSPTDFVDEEIILVDNKAYEEIVSQYSNLNHKVTFCEAYEDLFASVNEENVVMVPYTGELLAIDDERTLRSLLCEKDILKSYYLYTSEMLFGDINFSEIWNGEQKSDFITSIIEEAQTKKTISQLESMGIYYNNDHNIIKVVYSIEDEPMIIDSGSNAGILPDLFARLSDITGYIFEYESIETYLNEEGEGPYVFTINASDELSKIENEIELTSSGELFQNSLLIVGRFDSNDYENIDSLSNKHIGIINNDILELALKIMYPKISVTCFDDTLEALEKLETYEMDYIIIDEFLFRYIVASEQVSNLTVVGMYNRNNQTSVLLEKEYKDLAKHIGLAANLSDSNGTVKASIENIVREEENDKKSITIFLIIAIMIITVILVIQLVTRYRYVTESNRLAYLSNHDSLTGGHNFNGIKKHLKTDKKSKKASIAVVDVVNFKKINDYLSYEKGNEILIKMYDYLSGIMSDKGMLARIGNDDFILVIYYEVIEKENEIASFLEDVYRGLYDYMRKIVGFDMEISIGAAIYDKNLTVEELYSRAENALLEVKKKDAERVKIYNQELHYRLSLEQSLTEDLHQAFSNNELVLYYQPQYAVEEKRFIGAEALIRWNHPTKGLLTPGMFLGVVQTEKYQKKLDFYVLNKAMSQLAEWKKEGREVGKLSVNVSPLTFFHDDFLEYFEVLKNEYAIGSGELCIEITEDFDIGRPAELENILHQLQELGCDIAVDDFGTGFSSMDYLVKLTVQTIKIDKSLIDNIAISKKDFRLVEGIIKVIQGQKKAIVIEGVEEKEQIDILSQFERLCFQGYYYSKPISKSAYESLME